MNEKEFETVMEAVCDICHWPFVEKSEDALYAHCEDCPVEKTLKKVGSKLESDKEKQMFEELERLRAAVGGERDLTRRASEKLSEKLSEKASRDEGKGRVPRLKIDTHTREGGPGA